MGEEVVALREVVQQSDANRHHTIGHPRKLLTAGSHSPAHAAKYRASVLRDELGRVAGDMIHAAWTGVSRVGAIGPRHRRAQQFARFGDGSMIAFPPTVIFGEGRIAIGSGTTIGPLASISAG